MSKPEFTKMVGVIFCPIQAYYNERDKWEKQHPKATIHFEVRSPEMVQEQIPQGLVKPGMQLQPQFFILEYIFYSEMQVKAETVAPGDNGKVILLNQ